MKTYQLIKDTNYCPKMLIFVNDQGIVYAQQSNPNNGLTYQDIEDHEQYPFNSLENLEDWEEITL